MLGWKTSCAATLFGRNRAANRHRIARVEHAVAAGHPTTTGVIDDLTRIEHTQAHTLPGIRDWHHAQSDWNFACCATPATRWSSGSQ